MRPSRVGGLLLAAGVAGPIGAALAYSLLVSLGGLGLLARGWTLVHWQAVLGDAQTWRSLAYSVLVAAASLGLSGALALAAAFFLGAGLGRGSIRWLLFVPLAMAPVAAGIAAVGLFGSTGLLARIAVAAGLAPALVASYSPIYAPEGYGIVLAQALLVTPFLLLLFDRVRANERVDELSRLAVALGATPRQAAWRVAVPVILAASRGPLGVYFVVLIGAFEIPLIVGAQSPVMLSVLVWQRFSLFDLGMRPQAHALAVLYTVATVAILAAVRRFTGRGAAARNP